MNKNIFRMYDIRGIFGEDLDLESVELIGRAFAAKLCRGGGKRITVARDGRLSSKDISDRLIEALRSGGIDVIDLGVAPTPLLYFSLFHLDTDGGIMITGSHNPPQYNGFKLCIGRDTLHGEQIESLYNIIMSSDFVSGSGTLESVDVITPYKAYLKDQFGDCGRGIKVVCDSGNGTGGLVAPDILRSIGCDVTELFSEVDGNFPNHHPDPTVEENLTCLVEKVHENGAAFGVGYDGDADRIGVVDENGEVLWGDKLLIIFAREILKNDPGATFISEVKASQLFFDDVRSRGGEAIMWKTGHSLIKAKMKETGAKLAGEMSGHMFFADRYFGFDDAIYATCRLVEILGEKLKEGSVGLSSLIADLPVRFSTPEIRVDCPDDEKFKVVEKAREYFKAYNVNKVDGLRIMFDDGWGLIRASNTQPVLVLRFEAESEVRCREIQSLVEKGLSEISKGIG